MKPPQIASVVALVLAAGCSSITMRIPRHELQADMAKRFPVRADRHVVTIQASDPRIEFPGAPDVIAVRLRLDATTATGRSQLGGTTRVQGRLEYVERERAFYLRDPQVTELSLAPARGTGLLARVADRATDAVGHTLIERATRSAVQELLRRYPVYRLDARRSRKEARAIRHLRSVHVEDQDLVLEVGL